MRILLVNMILHTAEKGKITRRATNRHTMIHVMARGFLALGHEVVLAASEEYKPLEEENPGFEVVYFPSRFPGIFRPDLLPWPRGFRRWLRSRRADFDLIISSEVFALPSLTASRLCPGKTIIWQEMNAYQKMMRTLPARFWYHLVARPLMRRIPVVARSASARQFISRILPRVCDEIVDHGADSEVFFPSESHKRSFVTVSQLIARKRLDRIIRHFADFVADPHYADYRLDIVGDGPERRNLEELAESLGIADSITFHGFQLHTRWAEIAHGATALLIDTEQDLNMVTVPEAIVNGTPLVMNTVPATAPFVADNEAGIALDNWDADTLRLIDRDYDRYHAGCLRLRPLLSNTGAASRLLSAYH